MTNELYKWIYKAVRLWLDYTVRNQFVVNDMEVVNDRRALTIWLYKSCWFIKIDHVCVPGMIDVHTEMEVSVDLKPYS